MSVSFQVKKQQNTKMQMVNLHLHLGNHQNALKIEGQVVKSTHLHIQKNQVQVTLVEENYIPV